MKSYDELKAEMEAIQQQMVEDKKEVKEFGFTTVMLKGSLTESRKKL